MFIAYRLAGYKGLPIVALIAFILIGIYMFLTLRTIIGRRIYAVGGNAKAAMLSGVNTQADGLPDLHQHGRAGGARRHDHRRPLQLRHPQGRLRLRAGRHRGDASSAARPPTAASGTVAGTVIGALFFGLLNIGMGVMSIPIDYQFVVKALVLLVAVYFDVRGRSREG